MHVAQPYCRAYAERVRGSAVSADGSPAAGHTAAQWQCPCSLVLHVEWGSDNVYALCKSLFASKCAQVIAQKLAECELNK